MDDTAEELIKLLVHKYSFYEKNNQLHCLSNVRTHRGKIIVEKASKNRMLSCGYHGRCFRLDGSFKSMPAFEEAKNFPTPADDLASIAFKKWAGLLFVSFIV